MVIDDLIVLGRAVPESTKDGRITVCLGGYSPSMGFIRIYPTRVDMPIKRWDIIKAEVERNEKDTRNESWKLVESRLGWDDLYKRVSIIGKLPDNSKQSLIDHIGCDCASRINDRHESLGLVKPTILRKYFKQNDKYMSMFQLVIPGFNEGIKVKRDYQVEPRVEYLCQNCQAKDKHDHQILEWGFYEWLRKNPDKFEQVWQNAGMLNNQNQDIYFFVGNQAYRRTSFMVISVLRFAKKEMLQKSFFF